MAIFTKSDSESLQKAWPWFQQRERGGKAVKSSAVSSGLTINPTALI